MADKSADSACPVDHKTRDAWLSHARDSESSTKASAPAACPVDHSAAAKPSSKSWAQTITSYIPFTTASQSMSTSATASSTITPSNTDGLDTNRVISSIPRSHGNGSSAEACPVEHGASANAEIESGKDASGNWVYPSEKMFFDAMKRKGYDAREVDMRTVVPIHNAVNEKAWAHIRDWEAPYLASTQCGGPKLESFANKNERMTPKARFNTILGYAAPFDRHDWVIDRCGTRVDYVIDFYAGRPATVAAGGAKGKGGPSFYLDVRPKLNTWEGVKMRAMRMTGLA